MTTFAIDYDGTWTADPEAFSAFAALLRGRGHRVLIVTARVSGHGEVRRACEAHVDRIIYSGADYKRDVCQAAAESVDVWIDDMPGMIGPDIPILGAPTAADARPDIDRPLDPTAERCEDCGRVVASPDECTRATTQAGVQLCWGGCEPASPAELRAEIDRLREQLRDVEEAAAVYRAECEAMRGAAKGWPT